MNKNMQVKYVMFNEITEQLINKMIPDFSFEMQQNSIHKNIKNYWQVKYFVIIYLRIDYGSIAQVDRARAF